MRIDLVECELLVHFLANTFTKHFIFLTFLPYPLSKRSLSPHNIMWWWLKSGTKTGTWRVAVISSLQSGCLVRINLATIHKLQSEMKGTKVPNPRHSNACDCTCVLTRNQSLSCDSLILAVCILFCFCLCKVRSRISDALWQALCNLSLAFLPDFGLSDFTAFVAFFLFGSKGMITVFVAQIITFKVRCWVTDTHTQIHRPSTVTLGVHARRGLITGKSFSASVSVFLSSSTFCLSAAAV